MQFALGFAYEDYINNHSEYSYLITLINLVDWSLIEEKFRTVGRPGYPKKALLKSLFIKSILNLQHITDLIIWLRKNPLFTQIIGFNIFSSKIPHASVFSRFMKNYNESELFNIISHALFSGIKDKIFDPSFLCIDSFPILFQSIYNNPKRFGMRPSTKSYFKNFIEAAFGYKGASNEDGAKSLPYFGYKGHTITFLNVPIFTLVSPASEHDSPYLEKLLQLVAGYLEISASKVLADKGYDSNKNHDFINNNFGGLAFIPLRGNTNINHTGKCGLSLKYHSSWLSSERNCFRSKFVCPKASDCIFKNNSNFHIGSYGCTSYSDSTTGNRLLLDRKSDFFKKVYSNRVRIESIFNNIETGSLKTTSLRACKRVSLEANLRNLFLVISALLSHKLGRSDLSAAPKKVLSLYCGC